jgi:hypothetical protein
VADQQANLATKEKMVFYPSTDINAFSQSHEAESPFSFSFCVVSSCGSSDALVTPSHGPGYLCHPVRLLLHASKWSHVSTIRWLIYLMLPYDPTSFTLNFPLSRLQFH